MSKHNLRRSLAALAFTAFATLSPLSDLHAASPVRGGRPEGQDVVQPRRSDFSAWKLVLRVFEKIGARIDDNGLRFATTPPDQDSSEKIGARIDDNG